MGFLQTFHLVVLFGMLGWAAYTDVKEGKVPNTLTATGLIVALALGVADRGLGGLRDSLWGIVAGGGPFLMIYLMGLAWKKPLMGAGDVKLMAAIGGFVGPLGALECMFSGMLVAFLAAVVLIGWCLARKRSLPRTVALGACLAVGTVLWLVTGGITSTVLGVPRAGLF